MSASLMDYTLPRAGDFPPLAFETANGSCRTDPLGVKGGRGHRLCLAVLNPVLDALSWACGIRHLNYGTRFGL